MCTIRLYFGEPDETLTCVNGLGDTVGDEAINGIDISLVGEDFLFNTKLFLTGPDSDLPIAGDILTQDSTSASMVVRTITIDDSGVMVTGRRNTSDDFNDIDIIKRNSEENTELYANSITHPNLLPQTVYQYRMDVNLDTGGIITGPVRTFTTGVEIVEPYATLILQHTPPIYPLNDFDPSFEVTNSQKVAFSFSVATSCVFGGVTIAIGRQVFPTHEFLLKVTLCTVVAGVPDEIALVISEVELYTMAIALNPSSDVPPGSYGYVNVLPELAVTLLEGVEYAFVLEVVHKNPDDEDPKFGAVNVPFFAFAGFSNFYAYLGEGLWQLAVEDGGVWFKLYGYLPAITPFPTDGMEHVNVQTVRPWTWEPGDADVIPDYYIVNVGGVFTWDTTDVYDLGSYVYDGPTFLPYTYWRIDSVFGDVVVEGTTWKFSDLVISIVAPTNIAPLDGSIDESPSSVMLEWRDINLQGKYVLGPIIKYAIFINGEKALDNMPYQGEFPTTIITGLKYNTTYTWKVAIVTSMGNIFGSEWTFTTKAIGAGAGGGPPFPIGTNMGTRIQRLLAAADDSIWYET
jgi:hypothetical protein